MHLYSLAKNSQAVAQRMECSKRSAGPSVSYNFAKQEQ